MNYQAPNSQRIQLDGNNIVVVPFSVVFDDRTEFRMALNVHKVVKVFDLESYDPLPASYAPFFGLVKIDEIPVPVFDLKEIFHKNESGKSLGETRGYQGRVIICNVQGIYVGALVDRTRKLEHHNNQLVMPPPAALQNGGVSSINAVINGANGYLYLLDVEAILEHYGIQFNQDSYSSGNPDILHGKRILVVEDSRVFQKRCLQVLEKHGALVEAACNGQEGLDLLQRNNYNYDLVFTDIEMPVMNGIDMARLIRERAPELPVLFNSAISNPAFIKDIKASKLGDYLIKFDEKTIIEKLVLMLGIYSRAPVQENKSNVI